MACIPTTRQVDEAAAGVLHNSLNNDLKHDSASEALTVTIALAWQLIHNTLLHLKITNTHTMLHCSPNKQQLHLR